MRKISSFIMACAMCLSMTVVGTVAPQVAVQAEETAAVELKEAPTSVPAVALDSDFFSGDTIYTLTYSVNEQNWIEAITSVEVNNQVYTKVSYSWDMGSNKYQPSGSSYNVKIGKQAFTEDVNKVVISADGYKDLVLEVNKDGKTVAIHTKHTGGTATCTKKAVCEFCGEEYGEYASHNYGDKYESDGTYHWKKCQNEGCDATTEKEAHKGGEATTTKRAVCEVCGAEYGAPKPADKTTESKKDDTKPAEKPDKKTVKAKKVVVNKKRIVLKKGKKVKLKVKLKPANATEKVTFKSSNKKVAKVTKNGVVKAVKKGKCKITVKTASGKKAVVKVTVK
nr:Ig-like domain-containing protein [uncultured Anaerobutyricum sp.]